MKYDWRKNDKQLYLPKKEPTVIEVPPASFFMIRGQGNPNNKEFEEAVGALYSLSHTVKLLPKKGAAPEGYYDYAVFPLEGIWDLDEAGRQEQTLDKNKLVYTIMIRQPDFVTESLASEVMEAVRKNKPSLSLSEASFGTVEEGLCLQMMHFGSYDDEPASFERMERFCEARQLERVSLTHKEIYISDSRKTDPDKLKTVLRFQIASAK